MKMILNIDPIRSAVTALGSASLGSVMNFIALSDANTGLQHAAWTVAIIAGVVAIINGSINIYDRIKKKLNARKKATNDPPVS